MCVCVCVCVCVYVCALVPTVTKLETIIKDVFI